MNKRKAAQLKYGVRSGLEADNCKHLEERGIPYEYEKHKISWEDHQWRTYTPDFVIQSNGIIVETKGRFTPADRRKHLKIKEQYPRLDIRFVFTNANSKINKGSKTSNGKWCEDHGFLYANKLIPEGWSKEPEVEMRIEDVYKMNKLLKFLEDNDIELEKALFYLSAYLQDQEVTKND